MTSSGLHEATKRSVILALKEAIGADSPDPILAKLAGNVEMEYPAEPAKYPGIWVQFSMRKIERSGISDIKRTVLGEPYMLGMYEGSVTLSIVALSSLERDRISDQIVKLFLFRETNETSALFFNRLQTQSLINFTVNQDSLNPSGQTVTIGAPWQQDLLVYEDGYSFNLVGHFASDPTTTELVPLSDVIATAIEVTIEPEEDPFQDDGNGVWQ
jgi:hypothetical protein